jgi:hypothetical protein
MKSNYEGWDWKKSIKKSIRKKTNNNKKNEDKIWYKNQMLNDAIKK